ncbi:MAG: 5,6-dimethylbenzimidazole synthase [Alphaproteobacteria bacterium]|nr:5,6-dimethylbenzimidazole synthase [Alphaproteobacteria bacterium]MBF0391688.1 5,6-dimethylbenzimidazole synthase [Alphaproteobacteria bacterium]
MTPGFDDGFRDRLEELILWRRDVRRFRGDAVDPALIERLIGLACLSPSVGNSQPWRFVLVEAPACRQAVRASFVSCNSDALHDYHGERARVYATLKLSGLDQAPVHLAVFCERGTATGHGLGRRTMPETLDYSVVAAVQTFWLAARAYGLGVGWVSILDPVAVATALDVPDGWALISYLCVGWPEEEHADPELVRHGWQDRLSTPGLISRR